MKWNRLRTESDKENDVVYYFSAECEHEGDISRECDEITEGGFAEIVDVDVPRHGDHDFYVEIYFKVLDKEGFENATGYSVDDFNIKNW